MPSRNARVIPNNVPGRAPRFGFEVRGGPQRTFREIVGAVAASVLLHLLVIGGLGTVVSLGLRYLRENRVEPATSVVDADPSTPEIVEQLRYFDVTPTDGVIPAPAEPGTATAGEQTPERAATPSTRPRPGSPPAAAPRAPGGAPTGDVSAASPSTGPLSTGTPRSGTGASSSADVLRPGLRDSRLYAERLPPPAPRPLSDHERYMARLEARLRLGDDSIAAERERVRRANDWTVKNKNGERYGFSPGKVHLGKLTLPMPAVGPPPAVGPDKLADRDFQRGEIQRGAESYDRAADREDRARAIRERKKAERETARPKQKPSLAKSPDPQL